MKKLNIAKIRIGAAWVILIGSIIAWPITALTVFKEEPQGILGLSWGAIILTAADLLSTQDVSKKTEDK